MFVRSSIRGNAAAAKSRCLSQVKKRYVTSARGQWNLSNRVAAIATHSGLSRAAACGQHNQVFRFAIASRPSKLLQVRRVRQRLIVLGGTFLSLRNACP
jgi:hypothetical protein